MCPVNEKQSPDRAFEAYRGDINAVQRRVAREIDPGARALVVAILVFVLIVALLLPHTGGVNGIDVLLGGDDARAARVALPHRIFCWLALVFGVGFSMLALLTRRWGMAWTAAAGSGIGCVFGMLAVWSRQTATAGLPGPGVGLYLAWVAVILLTFHWIRVVWERTAAQLAEEQLQRQAAEEQPQEGLLRRNERKHGAVAGDPPANSEPAKNSEPAANSDPEPEVDS